MTVSCLIENISSDPITLQGRENPTPQKPFTLTDRSVGNSLGASASGAISRIEARKRPHEQSLRFWQDQLVIRKNDVDTQGIKEAYAHIRAAKNAIFAIEQGRQ